MFGGRIPEAVPEGGIIPGGGACGACAGALDAAGACELAGRGAGA